MIKCMKRELVRYAAVLFALPGKINADACCFLECEVYIPRNFQKKELSKN